MERQILNRRNSEYALFKSQREFEPQRRQLLKANQWADQAQRERTHLCSWLGMKDPIFIKNAVREVAEKLKSWKDAAIREGNYSKKKNNEDKKNFLCSMIRNHERWVYWVISDENYKNDWNLWKTPHLLRPWLTEHLWRTYVPHQALITSSSRKPSRDVGMPRNTRENMSITGNAFDCQHARRDPGESHNDSRNLATLLAFVRKEGNWE